MRISNAVRFATFGLLVLFNVFLLRQNIKYKIALMCLNIEVETEDGIRRAHDAMTINDSFLNNGTNLQGTILFDIKKDAAIDIKKLFEEQNRNKAIMFCRFSEYDCEQCVSYAICKAIDFFEDTSQIVDLIMLGNYSDIHAMKVYCSNIPGSDNYSFYNVPDALMPLDEKNNPYYFVLDSSLRVFDAFTPDKMDPTMTDAYFELLSKKTYSEK